MRDKYGDFFRRNIDPPLYVECVVMVQIYASRCYYNV